MTDTDTLIPTRRGRRGRTYSLMSGVTIRIGIEKVDFIELPARPKPCITNLIRILGEYPNRSVPLIDICDRLGVNRTALRTYITILRRYLNPEQWIIAHSHPSSYRLVDLRDR